jgi:multiple RNA-binding domain-containing protein 1
MKKADKSRLFGFVGFKTEGEAAAARKFFNNSFIDTSKIVVDFAKP